MRRRKNTFQRADEWAMNLLLAAHVAKDYDEFVRIRLSRREIPVGYRVSKDYYDFIVKVIDGLKEPRTYSKEQFDTWFATVFISNGAKGGHYHIRIPRMDHKTRKEFGEVLWLWVSLIRSKDVEVQWR